MKRLNYITIFVLMSIMTVGCATEPKNLFVLLPSPDGHTGEMLISRQGVEKKLNTAYQATGLNKADEPLSETFVMEEQKVTQIFQPALASQPAIPVVFLLYFGSNSANLTEDSVKLLPEIIAQIIKSASSDVSIIGHTDRVGNKEMNLRLSTDRAKTVFEQLVKLGATPAIFEVTSHGMENPLVDTPEGIAEPKNRRVEVVVR